MSFEAWLLAGLLVVMLAALASSRFAVDLVMLGVLTFLVVSGISDPADAVSGYANQGLITVALLYVLAAGLKETGAINLLTAKMLGRPKTVREAQLRLILPVAFLSAFANNTPIVASFLPVIDATAKRCKLPASKLYMPLSFAAILGGLCTLIGTSTTLIIAGLIIEHNESVAPGAGLLPEFGMFTIAKVGIPIAIVGVLYMLLFGRKLLPEGDDDTLELENARQYMTAMRVEPGSPRLLPFRKSEVAWIARLGIHETGRHAPAVLQVNILGKITQLELEKGNIDGRHGFGADTRPDHMRMPPTFLLVKDNRARLAGETQLLFGCVDGGLEGLHRDRFQLRRIEAEREQKLPALRGAADRPRLHHGVTQVIGCEAAQLVQLHVLVLSLEKVARQVSCATARIAVQDHDGSAPERWPSAVIRSARMAWILMQARRSSASVSGVTGKVPVFAARASWLTLLARREAPSWASTRARALRSWTLATARRFRPLASRPSSRMRMYVPSAMPSACASRRARSSVDSRKENGAGRRGC